MQEVFYEESVSMHDERPAKRRYTVFTVFTVLCIIFALFSLLNIMWMNVSEGFTQSVIVSLIFWGVSLILMVAAAIFFTIKKHSFFVSYDYTFVSGELRISKVFHNRKRKLLYRLEDVRLIKIGRFDSESYKKLKSSPDNKEDILTPNAEAEEGKEFFYIQASTNVGKKILVLECRLQLIYTIVRYMNKNILESEFNRK